MEYDAFGAAVSRTGTTNTQAGFAGNWGYQTDAESEYQLLGHRYYDPATGRFLTRDPIRDGRNWYGYCENNPHNWVDPEGLQPHGNTIGDQPATLYVLFDRDGNILKYGVTHHVDPNLRYSRARMSEWGGVAHPLKRGPRREMLAYERDLVETRPGPANKERWAGARRGQTPKNEFLIRSDSSVDHIRNGRKISTYRMSSTKVPPKVKINRSKLRNARDR
jgi:RHS repeat-associated protein